MDNRKEMLGLALEILADVLTVIALFGFLIAAKCLLDPA